MSTNQKDIATIPYLISLDCQLFSKFKNSFIKSGKLLQIERSFAFILFKSKFNYGLRAVLVFYSVVNYLKPVFVLVPRRKSTRLYILPTFLKQKQQYYVALRWLVKAIKKQNEILLSEKVIFELITLMKLNNEVTEQEDIDTSNLTLNLEDLPNAFQYKIITYAIASDNRTILHFRWH